MMEKTHQPVIVTGMHRSGTSLTTSILQSAGIDIGDRLMGATEWNSKGFFEDWDFVELHQDILGSQGLAIEGWIEQKSVAVEERFTDLAQELIVARKDKGLWGWKDPRTVLFLDFWLEQLPTAKFIFVFRSPWEVVDSLFRRGDEIFSSKPSLALTQWQIYNEAILGFYRANSERCFLLDVQSVISSPEETLSAIAEKLKLNLRSPENLYEQALFEVDASMSYRRQKVLQLFPEIGSLSQKLEKTADLRSKSENIKLTVDTQTSDIDEGYWFIHNWHHARKATHLKKLLQQSQQELSQTQELLQEARQQQYILQEEINQLKLLIAGMESSKFWQIRNFWLQLKQKLGMQEADKAYQEYRESSEINNE